MPIYCNDSTLLYLGNNMVETYKDYFKKAELREMKEQDNNNISDYIINGIIDQCSLIIDEIDEGYIIEESYLQDLVYLENVLNKIILNIERAKKDE